MGIPYSEISAAYERCYPYFDQYRFLWLEAWKAGDFSTKWSKMLPEMGRVTHGDAYNYPVPANVGNVPFEEGQKKYYYYKH